MKKKIKNILPNSILKRAKAIKAYANYYEKLDLPFKVLSDSYPENVLQCSVAYNQYGGYCIPLSSLYRPAAQKIFHGEVYEPDTIKFIIDNCSEGDIIHAGTFFGDFLPALSSACESTIWAFEPNPENYKCAQITLSINEISNVNMNNAGLGEEKKYVPLQISSDSGKSLGGASKFVKNKISQDKQTVSIPVIKMDDCIPEDRDISILQLDVEGYEKLALSGGLKTIKRCKPILILETVPSKNWMRENIFCLGYNKAGKVHANTIFIVN